MPYTFPHEFKPGDLITWIPMYRSWASHRGYGKVVMFIRYTDGLPYNLRQCEVLTADGKLRTFLSEDFARYNGRSDDDDDE